jgi:hypothetical protein
MPAAILLILAVVFYRLVLGASSASGLSETFANFAPVAAILFCGACFLPRRIALLVALGSLLVSDIVLNYRYAASSDGVTFADTFLNVGFLLRYAAFAGVFALGAWMARRNKRSLPLVFGGTLAASLLFYLASNTGAWLSTPEYAKTLAGWLQSQTTGLPGFPPAWTFLRNSLVSDLLFTGLFVLAVRPHLLKLPAPQTASASTAN